MLNAILSDLLDLSKGTAKSTQRSLIVGGSFSTSALSACTPGCSTLSNLRLLIFQTANPWFTFISVLKREDQDDEAAALKLLRALAAQVKPLCKEHGLGVNSFEEARQWWNQPFFGSEVLTWKRIIAFSLESVSVLLHVYTNFVSSSVLPLPSQRSRVRRSQCQFHSNSLTPSYQAKVVDTAQWNGGEVVEIVLRSPAGRFMPMGWLIHVVCHELAHIKQMNHSNAFNKVNNAYRAQVRQLQARGYFGDGALYLCVATERSVDGRFGHSGLWSRLEYLLVKGCERWLTSNNCFSFYFTAGNVSMTPSVSRELELNLQVG